MSNDFLKIEYCFDLKEVIIPLRIKRLYAEWQRMLILNDNSELVEVQALGDPPEKYIVTFSCKGLIWNEKESEPSIGENHRMKIYLHKNFPRFPPKLTWLTDIFHPNILPPSKNGGVCIGNWTPAETLDQLCIRIGEMIQYRNFSITDALNTEAAAWVASHMDMFPIDLREFWLSKGNNESIDVDL